MPLTPNTNCSVFWSGDLNYTTLVEFMTPPSQLVCWSTTVSAAASREELNEDKCCQPENVNCDGAAVTFKEGLTVTYQPSSGSGYYIFLSGKIVDTGQTYTLNNMAIYMSTP